MDVVEVRLSSILSEEEMAKTLADIEYHLPEGECGILLLTDGLVSYDMAAQPVFIDWINKNVDKISKLAVVSGKQIWHLLITTASNRFDVPVATFYEEEGAKLWLSRQGH